MKNRQKFESLFNKVTKRDRVDESAEREGLAISTFRREFVVAKPKHRSQLKKMGR